MPVDFPTWARQPDTIKIYLVEISAQSLADGHILPLYFATHNVTLAERCYLGCVSGLPRLTRQANDTLTPDHIPTWGELELLAEMDYLPDAYRSVTWLELLSPAWNLRGQPLTILVGGEGFAYEDFQKVFTGRVGSYTWNDGKVILTIYDKGQDLTQKIPDYDLPESPRVLEGSWNQTVPLLLGLVKNFRPIVINSLAPGTKPWRYALACHAIAAVDMVYYNDVPLPRSEWDYLPRDLLPAAKNGDGAAVLEVGGTYSGSLVRAEWLVQIDSISTPNEVGDFGPTIGLATFRWSLDDGLTWQASGLLTWKLAVDAATLAKPVSLGPGTMTLAGEYTGQVKYPYRLKISTDGYVGSAKFRYSRDNGATWSDEILITETAPIPFDKGLTAALVGPVGSIGATTKIPIASSLGTAAFGGAYDATSHRHYRAQIVSGGNVGAATFKWSDDGGDTWHDGPYVTGENVSLNHGITISFFAGIVPDPPPDPPLYDFDAGDEFYMHVPAFIAEDYWTWAFKEVPIPLSAGVTIQFSSGLVVTKAPAAAAWPFMFWWFVTPSTGQMTVSTSGYNLDVDTKYQLVISTGGTWGTAVCAWSDDGGLTWHNNIPINASPINLSNGVSVSFGPDDSATFNRGDRFLFTVPAGLGADFAVWDEWRAILGGTLFLGVGGDGANISADVRGLISPVTNAYVEKIGEIIEAIVVGWREWQADTDFDPAALAAFNAAIPYQVGLVVNSPTEINKIIDNLLTGIPALYSITLDGRFFITEINPAAIGEPLMELTDIELQAPPEGADADDNLFRRVYIHFDHNENSESNPQAGAQPERIAWLQKEYRQVSARDDSILRNYPCASDLGPLDTCLKKRSEAQALADKLLALYKARHDTRKVTGKVEFFLLNLWSPMALRRTRYQEQLSQKFAILGLEQNFNDSSTVLTLWR